MAAQRQDLPLQSLLGDDHIITDNNSTTTGTSVPPTSCMNSPNPPAMSTTGSGAGSLRPLDCVRRPRQPTASEEFKVQLSYAI